METQGGNSWTKRNIFVFSKRIELTGLIAAQTYEVKVRPVYSVAREVSDDRDWSPIFNFTTKSLNLPG